MDSEQLDSQASQLGSQISVVNAYYNRPAFGTEETEFPAFENSKDRVDIKLRSRALPVLSLESAFENINLNFSDDLYKLFPTQPPPRFSSVGDSKSPL